MSLRIRGWRSIVKWAFWSLLTLVFLIFLIRVATFEAGYYAEKEGSERAAVNVQTETADLDENKPTDAEVREYKVDPDEPRYLTVDRLGVKNARVLPMEVNMNGELDTPNNIFDVGWYSGSGKPGEGGTLVIDGHNGGPHVHGVFKNLPSLTMGDVINIERGDGVIFKYKVVENTTVPLSDSDQYMAVASTSPEEGVESVTLISCTGEWSQAQDTYLSRQFTRAVLME